MAFLDRTFLPAPAEEVSTWAGQAASRGQIVRMVEPATWRSTGGLFGDKVGDEVKTAALLEFSYPPELGIQGIPEPVAKEVERHNEQ